LSRRRVVITGLGILSPLGIGVEENWRNLCAGHSGIGPVTRFDAAAFRTRIAGEVKDFEVTNYLPAKEARRMDRFIQLGMAASIEAIQASGLEVTDTNASRIGVHLGSGIGGVGTIESTTQLYLEKGPRRVSPFFVPMSIANMLSGDLSVMFGLKGPNLTIVTACSTATHSIGDAARLIEYGDADVMVAGGAEAAITPTSLAGFSNAKALSTRNDDPTAASRPWDKDRDGFVLSEGAGVVILEELSHAQKRGATIYSELAGFGLSGDAYHMTSPSEDGDGAVRCMQNAMRNASINVSSTKSMTGHLLGAAGGVEAVYTALSIYHHTIPATINLVAPDEDCDLDFVPGSAREKNIKVALSNSFGFGGTNGTLVMCRAT